MNIVLRFSAAALSLAAGAAGPSVHAGEQTTWKAPTACPLLDKGWRALRFDGKNGNDVRCGADRLSISSFGGVSLDYIAPPQAVTQATQLSWTWTVTQSGGPASLTQKGSDDRDLALLVAFKFKPDEAGLLERMTRPFLKSGADEPAPGRVIAYTWAGGQAVERADAKTGDGAGGDAPATEPSAAPEVHNSPYGGARHRIRVLRRGPGGPFAEMVDLAGDHARFFGPGPYEIQYIAVVADTDARRAPSEAEIGGIMLSAP